MAVKNVKGRGEIIPLEVASNSDLQSRLKKISEQVGLSPQDLFQKWVLQEEFLIGLMRRSDAPAAAQTEALPDVKSDATQPAPGVQKRKSSPRTGSPKEEDPDKLNYRKTLLQKARKLQKEGKSLKKIAEAFNGENLATMSGTGKWYASSIVNLLKSNV